MTSDHNFESVYHEVCIASSEGCTYLIVLW